ncbi:VanZ family protein [Streptococcus moroccensis]|uniref:Glycopeptide antibiotics resistance protein n=1 Tax=Streptococcus moroccensis TaxID=1451356 RepID=A0ABT9YND4_9STRE|nr:VanZ family protein [Streptococcus moroccensis]MDQ0221501.1 glycopeptide antibiotics resistance protein [Streptococcus moroccensis]
MTRFLTPDFELTPKGQRVARWLTGIYGFLVALMCFLPQDVFPEVKEVSTPGIMQIGRLYILPVPFNSLVNANQVESPLDYFWILLQNVANIFLLFPLVLGLLFLFPKWRSWQKALLYSFYISLTIECTQLLIDLLIDAKRVFEVDDLWTNALGGLLAYVVYMGLKKAIKRFSKNVSPDLHEH